MEEDKLEENKTPEQQNEQNAIKIDDAIPKDNIVNNESKDDIDDNDDIFISEKDTFDIKITYQKVDGNILIKDADEDFDDAIPSKSIAVTFKYPSQGDVSMISVAFKGVGSVGTLENIDLKDFINVEFARLLCLIRSWSLKTKISRENISSLHPRIVKAMLEGLRNKIGMDGIL